MKKIIAILMTIITLTLCFGTVAHAKVGDVIGSALHTDIVVYINNYAIPSYAVNGTSVIVAEDLRNFGFDVVWNGYSRSLDIYRNSDSTAYPMYVGKGYTTGTKYTNILSTDISVWAYGQRLTSYAMNGFTMIPVEELTMFGEITWMAESRALKMWVDGLNYSEDQQLVANRYYPGTTVPDYGWITESICVEWEDEWDGDMGRLYISNAADVQQYINYIKSQGWVLDESFQDDDGIWYSGYINKRTRTGVAISEASGLVYIQIAVDVDGWTR